jgi:lysozyme
MLRSLRLVGGLGGASLALILALFAAAPADARNPYPRKGDSDPHDGVSAARMHPVQGIDVSHYQLDIDWRKVREAGTRFAFIKATEGGDMLDPRFRDNWREAKEAGVPRGAYHFVFWCRPARDQARWFIRNVPKDPDALPPVLDVEWSHKTSCRRPSAETARAKMREMLKAFEAHYGKKPVIYTDINFHEDVLAGTREFDDYPFWVRSVADRPEERYERRPWEFWQFTATGTVPGIRGDVDRNAFFGSERQFRDWVEGRFDIGTRRMLREDVKVAAPKAAPAAAPAAPVTSAFAPSPVARTLPPLPNRQLLAQNDEDDQAKPRKDQPMRLTPPAERLLPPGRVGEARAGRP